MVMKLLRGWIAGEAMKNFITKYMDPSLYAAIVGSLVVPVCVPIYNTWRFGFEQYGQHIEVFSALVVYAITAFFSFVLALVVGVPAYLLCKRFDIANYYTSGIFGFLLTSVFFGVDIHKDDIVWNVAGILIGVLCYHRFESQIRATPQI